MMQALTAEGYRLLDASESALDAPGVLASRRHGTVVRSWLPDLLVRAVDQDPRPRPCRAGWTVDEAVRLVRPGVPTPVPWL